MRRSNVMKLLARFGINEGEGVISVPDAQPRTPPAEPRATDDPGPASSDPRVSVDLPAAALIEQALARREGVLDAAGALHLRTGAYTGRAPKSRFIVEEAGVSERIAWGAVNHPISRACFERVRDGVARHLAARDLFVTQGLAGADRTHARSFLVACERASQALFVRQILVRPTPSEQRSDAEPDFVVLVAPGFHCDPERDGTGSAAAVLIDFTDRMIVIAGTGYSGEIKKSIFSVMNYILPVEDDVLTMHCSATTDRDGRGTAIFFGLSGTGKTTLSADPERLLIGDDEHGWGSAGVFNLEGGCYAKCDNLDASHEPEIFNAVRFGCVSENVVLRSDRVPDYTDLSITRNTRACYPIEHISSANARGMGPEPTVILFLTCDAFGVLPAIARLTPEAAMYHFVTGFTAKVSGTEQGVDEPTPTFSALFGEPFMPLDPMVYANMLGCRLRSRNARVYLLNTGWIAGPAGEGRRIELASTRALVRAALEGTLDEGGYARDPIFNVDVPARCPGVPDELLDPRALWSDAARYDISARRLAAMFRDNFDRRCSHLPDEIRAAGPLG
ncbi:phosphoenolpyruvate carboxykinase (ATP) [Coriobacterium glomerans PW2]|uniref:Phosphoenolpyruvate carboxykinase (ATP) n=1 Tax=Coriobacterium glomerans (strain ATCC 49209 / DSM 20642 / JCM 10262 / PW2) TaxID=700015 RepID=F2N7F8_CORGP|nr:phosphoenolpyruvate carboxykinase (ATP) [Coriobacterium glomerans]AEB06774.1 phosphoenolpyruvate carboxykinase (ATP) [Coriobacterium glomerans PW2]